MKKILLTALLMGLSSLAVAGPWDEYRDARNAAKADLMALESGTAYHGKIEETEAKFVTAAVMAEAVKRPDIQAWQIQNAGYAYILYFKSVTSWDKANADIMALAPKSPERKEAVKQLQSAAQGNMELLDKASALLDQAATLSAQEDLTKVIESNRGFIEAVKALVAKSL